jgi:hypothetical protein
LEQGTPAIKEMVDVVLRDRGWLAAAQVIPPREPGSVGRPRSYPDYVWFIWTELRSIFRSHTAVERELLRGSWWRYIRGELRRLYPDLPELPMDPPRRQHYEYMRDTYLITHEALQALLETHTEVATSQAKEAGNIDLKGAGSFTHPDLTRALFGDGKVLTPLFRGKPGETRKIRHDDGTVEERPVRFDPDAALHTEGGGGVVRGVKFAHVSTRRSEGRFILALEHVDKERDEATAAMQMLRRIKPHAPGAQALVWDMILRGTHINTILTEFGLVPVVGVHAKERIDRRATRKRDTFVAKTKNLDDIEVVMPDGSSTAVHLAAHNGWCSIKELTETGEPYYEHLPCTRIQRHRDKAGYRFYGYFRLPEKYGREEVAVRLHQSDEDTRRRINRTENLRPIPEGSEDFKRLFPLRSDAESINRGIEDSLWINRASAKGWRRQLVDLLGYARLVNALTFARCRGRPALGAAA